MRSVFKIHNAIIKKTKTLEKLRVGEIGETPRDQNKKCGVPLAGCHRLGH